jgi:hypothetical protein
MNFILAGKYCSRCAEKRGVDTIDYEKEVIEYVIQGLHYAEEALEVGEIDKAIHSDARAFAQDVVLICALCNKKEGIDRVNRKIQREIVQAVRNGRIAIMKERFKQRKKGGEGEKKKVSYLKSI